MSKLTKKLTIRLPSQDVEFVKRYAKHHRLNVSEVIDRYLRRIRALESYTPSPELEAIIGIIPTNIHASVEVAKYKRRKHGE